jgi:hypothetical protein
MKALFFAFILLLDLITVSHAEDTLPVNVDNFIRAETDHYLKQRADNGYFGKIKHIREPVSVKDQPVVRVSRDFLLSYAVFDLTTPVTITMPDAKGRFQSLRAINEDHYIVSNTYDAGDHVFTEESVGTRYMHVAIRTVVDPDNAKDAAAANALQDQISWKQDSVGKLELPNWDAKQLDAVRKAILGLATYLPDSSKMFGAKNEVDAVRHLIGTAGGWGGGSEADAYYINETVPDNDGTKPYTVKVKDVPVDGFWSVTVYNADGYMEKSPGNATNINNITGKKDAGGTYTIHFGGDAAASNYLAIYPGWNYTVRLYRARDEVLRGKWVFPKATPNQ